MDNDRDAWGGFSLFGNVIGGGTSGNLQRDIQLFLVSSCFLNFCFFIFYLLFLFSLLLVVVVVLVVFNLL